ncbi:LPS biosynthesis protein [Vibrio sp. ZSDE26]|uniref:LPS biosynthesis protein n=1 Tax=Vibrio amylolyticus TaxID=2847292 RepID=A0A9X2BGT8_9VIBR|nr:glycosyltransferase family 9 protein [Vibrio amylolyticus]MCK6263269.1 LPS biosynthesis protein [Vibrio amylolyticus]
MIRKLRLAYPDTQIDALVTVSGKLALAGNTDLNNLITVGSKPKLVESLKLLKDNFYQYDWVINDKPSGKSEIYAMLFSKWLSKGSWRSRVVNEGDSEGWRTSRLFSEHTVFESSNEEHRIIRNFSLLSPLSLDDEMAVIAPENDELPSLPKNYIVIHCPSSNQVKQWPVSSWKELIERLEISGHKIVLTGSPSARDENLLSELMASLSPSDNIVNLSGSLSIAQTSSLIKSSQGYIGADSGITHLASGHNVPIICIISVAAASMWAPWPYRMSINEYEKQPYRNGVRRQVLGNVTILQSTRSCVPCGYGACRTDEKQVSPCLSDISPNEVFESVVKSIHYHQGIK